METAHPASSFIETGFETVDPAVRLAGGQLCDARNVGIADWEALSRRAAEANAFLAPDYYTPLAAHARQARPGRFLTARDRQGTLTALAPLVTAWIAFRLPVPALVVSQPYLPLGTPLLDAANATAAAIQMIEAAEASGAAMLAFRSMHLEGPVASAFREALAARGLEPFVRNAHRRAAFDATGDVEAYLRDGLGGKKLKELRRQRNRLSDLGLVEWRVASKPEDVGPALERFLVLESRGWKGRRGTALGQIPGDAAFIREAIARSSRRGTASVCELLLDGTPVASGLVFKAGRTAFFLKTAYDEAHTRLSPGVLFTVELTRHFAEDPTVDAADSVAVADHPMIDHIWRERLPVGDFYVPTGRGIRPKLCMAAFDGRDRLRRAAKSARDKAVSFRVRKKGTAS